MVVIDAGLGEALKKEGMRRVAEANSEWFSEALPIVQHMAETNATFSTDDLRPVLDEYVAIVPTDNRVIGPLMAIARESGWVELSGEVIRTSQAASHRSPKHVWRSLIYQEAA